MQFFQRVNRYAVISMAAIILAACASQKEPAQKLIGDIESTVAAASTEAAKYVPDQLADVQAKLAALKASFDKQDYASVVTGGPAVLTAAQNLATAAAAKKDEVLKALNDEWTGLAGSLPGEVAAVQSRIDVLSKRSNKKQAKGIDLDAAKAGLGDATSLWSKAQAAFAAGNLDEAVTAAKDVKAKVEAVAATLKLDLSAAGATPAPSAAQ
jgi:DNA repair exonuclease SbcCD ATPase subunit